MGRHELDGPMVYLAAPFIEKEAVRAARAYLATRGIGCTARWIDSHKTDLIDMTHDQCVMEALHDLEDIAACDFFILLDDFAPSTGRNVELGFALAMEKPVVRVGGAPMHLFHHLVNNIESIEMITGAQHENV